MKIGDCGGSERIVSEKAKSRGTSAASDKEFTEILKAEMAGVQVPAGLEPVRAGEIQAAGAATRIVPLSSMDPNMDGWANSKEVERLEGVLGDVSSLLGSGNLGLRQIEESLQRLARESEWLKSFARELPAGHPLLELERDLSVLSHVESVKWRRGDYV